VYVLEKVDNFPPLMFAVREMTVFNSGVPLL